MQVTKNQETLSDGLAEHAVRIAERSNEDGTVDVKITSVDKQSTRGDDTVRITFETPQLTDQGTNKTQSEVMSWPHVDSDSYKLVSLCRETVGTFAGVTQLEGSWVHADPDSWEIVVTPETSTSTLSTVLSHKTSLETAYSLVFAPVLVTPLCGLAYLFASLIALPQDYVLFFLSLSFSASLLVCLFSLLVIEVSETGNSGIDY